VCKCGNYADQRPYKCPHISYCGKCILDVIKAGRGCPAPNCGEHEMNP
jgi:hypothetical protein